MRVTQAYGGAPRNYRLGRRGCLCLQPSGEFRPNLRITSKYSPLVRPASDTLICASIGRRIGRRTAWICPGLKSIGSQGVGSVACAKVPLSEPPDIFAIGGIQCL